MNAMQPNTAQYDTAAPWWQIPTVQRLRTDRAYLRKVLMYGGIAVVAVVAATAYLMGGRYVSTDDAYIASAKLMVSTDVSGLVQTVNVKEGQYVNKGDVLFTLDPQPFRIALQNAQSMLAQTVQTVASTKADYQQNLAAVDARESASRSSTSAISSAMPALVKANAIAPATYDPGAPDARRRAAAARRRAAEPRSPNSPSWTAIRRHRAGEEHRNICRFSRR